MVYAFDAVFLRNGTMDAGDMEAPFDGKAAFGKGRVAVRAAFDEVPYDGQVVRMGTPCRIIGVRKDIRKTIGKTFVETVHVTLEERKKQGINGKIILYKTGRI